jgi:hypothetical protein
MVSAEQRSSQLHSDEIEELLRTTDPRRIEVLADVIGAANDRSAIRPLLWRLGDSMVQDDPDIEDAVCGALVALSVMTTSGNQCFALRPAHELPPDVVSVLRELAVAIPARYLLRPGGSEAHASAALRSE